MIDSQSYDSKSFMTTSKDNTSSVNNLSSELTNILALKKNIFESTSDFEKRQNNVISEFENKEKEFLQNGSQNYSAGLAKMIRYNPDTEILTLTLNWNKNIVSLLPECKKFQTLSFYINRKEAKKLFKNKDTHFFHIKVKYINQKLKISEIFLYGKYKLYKNSNIQVDTLSNENMQNDYISKIKKTDTCMNYIVTANQLNIRNKPQLNSSVLGKINRSEIVCIYKFKKNWAQSEDGWISKKYLIPEQYIINKQNNKPVAPNNKSNTEIKNKDSSSLPIAIQIILVLIGLSLLIAFWQYALLFIFIIIVYNIFN
jgi:hypothetical protein